MPVMLLLLSLLGGCSGMLDLPDRPRVSTETAAPLQAQPGGGSEQRHGWGQQPAAARPSAAESSLADAGTTSDGEPAPEDAGSELRLSSR